MVLRFKELCKFRGACGFTGTLKADHQNDRRFSVHTEGDIVVAISEKLDHLVMDDLDDHVARRDFGKNLLTDCFFFDFTDEVVDDIVIDIGFQQCFPYFGKHFIHILFRQGRLAADLPEYTAKAVAEAFKCHGGILLSLLHRFFFSLLRKRSSRACRSGRAISDSVYKDVIYLRI